MYLIKTTNRVALVALLLTTSVVAAAKVSQTAYFLNSQASVGSGALVTWNDRTMRARLADAAGAAEGAYRVSGNRHVITYESPRISEHVAFDGNCVLGYQYRVRREITQTILTTLSGTPRVGSSGRMDLGSDTALDGCLPGQVTPVGDAADTGGALSHVALSAAPPQRALVAGDRWAGLMEGPRIYDSFGFVQIAQDVARVSDDGQSFIMGTSGTVMAASLGADGWLSTLLPAGTSRVYKRVALDSRSGAEVWLAGDRSASGLEWVDAWRMVTPQADAAFPSARKAAHVWRKSDPWQDVEYRLFSDLTGVRVIDYVDASPPGDHVESPVTWTFSRQALHTLMAISATQRDRLWTPLARFGKQQWVLESEDSTSLHDGQVRHLILPRVAWYTDMGAAVKPPATATAPRATADTARRETAAAARPRR